MIATVIGSRGWPSPRSWPGAGAQRAPEALRWAPIIGAALVGVVVLPFVPAKARTLSLGAGTAAVLRLVLVGLFTRLGTRAVPRPNPDRLVRRGGRIP